MAANITKLVCRRLSTSSALRQDLVKTPIPVFGISGTYAHALYSAASKAKAKSEVAQDLTTLQEILKNQKVADYMHDPFVETSNKLGLLKEVASKVKMTSTVVNFFGVLADNRRLNLVGETAEVYARIMSAERGEVPATVTTATEMDVKQRKNLEAALTKFLKPNEKLMLTTKVDPTILGGIIVDIGDKYTDMKYVDMSTASKVALYSDLIRQNV
ncbi:ATP synthase subunit O, mitochondrial-like [Styela clava]|uniref:ATP synthase subunit O, mitochondrial-like n=1 Tax=Styela clava TaxID=7725 RepID=UPI0019397222|nr:ATP synthase subunit O, mitochondrial-like [Styela clava]